MVLTPCENRSVLEPCALPALNYQIDPYIGCEHYCYYCYVLPQAETDWTK
jgi:DNA repair photolyase